MQNKKVVELDKKVKLIISKELQNQILYAHSEVGDIEWSGFLLFNEISGNISDNKEFVLKAEYAHILDVGTSGYTEFTMDERIVEMYEEYPEAIDSKVGILHTHHSMATFFSGTDSGELQDNAHNYPYYLSLIVNHKGQYCAKIAFVAKQKGGLISYFKNIIKLPEEDILCTMDCIIELEVDSVFSKRIEDLKTTRTKIETSTKYMNYGVNKHGWDGIGFDSYKKPESKYQQLDAFNSYKPYNNDVKNNTVKGKTSIESFLVKLLTLDQLSEETLINTINLLDEKLGKNDQEIDIYVELIDDNFTDYYQNIIGLTPNDNMLSDISASIMKLLEPYSDKTFVYELLGIFDLYIPENELHG